MKALAIVLAAGESRRMGRPKALLEVAVGVSFVARLVETFAAATASTLVVTGAHAEQLAAAHPGFPTVMNPAWPLGQLGSVQVGLRAALLQGAERILIHPVDSPLILASTAARVLAALADGPAVVPTFEGQPGHPLGLNRSAAAAILTTPGKTLAEAVGLIDARLLPVDDPAILDNLNSPEAYAARFGHAPRGPATTA